MAPPPDAGAFARLLAGRVTPDAPAPPPFAQLARAGFRGTAIPLADLDLLDIGERIGVGEDELHAIIDVESSGSGFDKHGRLKMLFEPHVYYRNLSGAKLDKAVAAGLAYKEWRPTGYPADSYPRLVQALALDETAALKAASWGLTQILGEGHREAGYASPQDMVCAFAAAEAAQLASTVELITSKGLAGALRARDWPRVARGWNGKQYARHGYDLKLKAAFAKWAKIPDTVRGSRVTPSRPAVAIPAVAPIGVAAVLGDLLGRLFGRA